MQEFIIEGEYIELYKLLKVEGFVHSGAAAKHAIDAGLVLVDDAVEYSRRKKIKKGSVVTFNDVTVLCK